MDLGWPTWIGVVAEDIEEQRRFYRDALGFRETDRSDDWVQFQVPGGGLFEVIRREPTPQYDATRFQVGFTVQDIDAAREELIRRGAEPISDLEPAEPGSPNRWCYFRDPEGNVFEITQWLEPSRQVSERPE